MKRCPHKTNRRDGMYEEEERHLFVAYFIGWEWSYSHQILYAMH